MLSFATEICFPSSLVGKYAEISDYFFKIYFEYNEGSISYQKIILILRMEFLRLR